MSRYKGVHITDRGYYAVYIYHNRKSCYLGTYDDEDKAAEAYNAAARSVGLDTVLNDTKNKTITGLSCVICGQPITDIKKANAKYCIYHRLKPIKHKGKDLSPPIPWYERPPVPEKYRTHSPIRRKRNGFTSVI